MKKYISILMMLVFLLPAVSACGKKEAKDKVVDTEKVSEIGGEEERVKKAIAGCENLVWSDDTRIQLPQDADRLYTFRIDKAFAFQIRTDGRIDKDTKHHDDMNTYDRQYREVYRYIFPDHKLNEDYLFYEGGTSFEKTDENGNTINDIKLVKDNRDALMAGKEGGVSYRYDESHGIDRSRWNTPVYLGLSNRIGYYGLFWRGKLEKLYRTKLLPLKGKNTEAPDYGDDIAGFYINLKDLFVQVGNYPPDSNRSFRLSDKEIPIKEAVRYIEAYFEKMPYMRDKGISLRVNSVDVLKISDDTYGYYFNAVDEYRGVQFNTMDYSGFSNPKGDSEHYYMCNGIMYRSDEIEYAGPFGSRYGATDEKSYDECVSPSDVIRKVSGKITDNVKFKVKRVALVYRVYGDHAAPYWLVNLSNPNDGMDYQCTMNALDGSEFEYTMADNE